MTDVGLGHRRSVSASNRAEPALACGTTAPCSGWERIRSFLKTPAPYSQRRGWGALNMHAGIALVREEIRCAANLADVTAAIAECRGVCSLRLPSALPMITGDDVRCNDWYKIVAC
jgi:hypothetical protein